VRIWAPAGFGKTILATQLIRSDPRPSAWIALEYADNDAMVLLRDVVAMLGELYAVRPELMLELTSPAPRIEDVVLPGVAEQLAGCDPSILVLDDLDQVTHPDSLVIVSFLIEHAPAGSQLVLVSRTEPEVPLARLRAAGEVLDLRAADLAFDARETRALLGDGGVVLSDEEVDQIRGRAEGWATGMALAMLSPDGPSIALGRPAIALGGSLEVAAYLLEEAVGGQPAERRAFLFGGTIVEVDETVLGGPQPGCRGRGALGKTLVVIAVEQDSEGRLVAVGCRSSRTRAPPRCDRSCSTTCSPGPSS
jgi:LuxR family maltose regulon positive regulatory protein